LIFTKVVQISNLSLSAAFDDAGFTGKWSRLGGLRLVSGKFSGPTNPRIEN
jgi:hypothetical protein